MSSRSKMGSRIFQRWAVSDVVILPPTPKRCRRMQLLNERGCHIRRSTTFLVVEGVKPVEKHKENSCLSPRSSTAKWKHEKTLATSFLRGTYLVVPPADRSPDGLRPNILARQSPTFHASIFCQSLLAPGFPTPTGDLSRVGGGQSASHCSRRRNGGNRRGMFERHHLLQRRPGAH